ncbi:vam6/Vps39-like protein [Teleopsis dalmanni]|uniref:vam6/Vps39-like protein n=1 Tax=Teleopsis dalmanni TaxID=139649 RepID=UPI0018CDA665|nr:vam6/Vps39-like protein [Teleopsis dalmanni]
MHQAYNVYSILKQGVHIESIAAFDNNVILGTRSGQLIMYSVDDNGAVDMSMFNKNFSKKAISQMEVISSEHLLFVLTDNIIHACDISHHEFNFAFIHSSAETKGCQLFCLDVKTHKSTTGEVAPVIRLCCAIKRRLQFFYWKVDALQAPEFAIELKDIPRALCWIDDVICVGFKDEYVIYDIHSRTPKKHELIVTSSAYNMEPSICILKNSLLGMSKDEYLVAIDPNDYIKREDNKLPNQGNFDSLSKHSDNKNILKPLMWSSSLLDLVWDEPYVIGRVSNGIEIRSLETNSINKDTLVQTIPELNKTKFLVRSGSGTIFAAATSELWCIRLVDIAIQRQQLLQQKKFQLAIDLTSISNEPNEMKAETIRQIHMRYAKELFSKKLFSAAMKEFEQASADPYDVIRLFPNLLQDQSNKPVTQGNDTVVPIMPVTQLEDKDLENALLALIEFLALARQKEVVKLLDTKSNSKSLLSIIDTTLLKCYLQTNDSLIGPLLRLNQCHLEESEKTLKKHEKLSELIILYQMNGKHRKALELLQAQSSKEGSSLFGTNRTILYLQQLGSAHIQLILEFANWVLKQDAEDGLRIFIEDFIEVENLPRASVLDFLLIHHKTLVIPYLEHVINVWKDTNTLLHNVLILQYREKVQVLIKSASENDSEQMDMLRKYRFKLFDILKNSNYYSPDVILQDFPSQSMLDELALILGRLKKHDKVLEIYVHILGDVQKAKKYCEDNYSDDSEIFVTLLKIILNPLKVSPYEGVVLHSDFATPNQDIILNLLNRYATKIKPFKVWSYLPSDMPLHLLCNYLDTVIRTETADQHHNEMMNALLTAEIERAKEKILGFEIQYVEINEFSVCLACKKRFTNQTSFVRYPNGEVVHLSCHDKILAGPSVK